MFISRVEIPWDSARNPYEWHRALWRLFPGSASSAETEAGGRRGFLFRVEESLPGRPTRVLLQSWEAPSTSTGPHVLATREFNPAPKVGQTLVFVLTANVVRTIRDDLKHLKTGKATDTCRVPLLRQEEQRAWLTRKLEMVGEMRAAEVQAHHPLYFRKGNAAGKLITVTFNGVLRVVCPDSLVALLRAGVGPAKAFGCGLLLVRRT